MNRRPLVVAGLAVMGAFLALSAAVDVAVEALWFDSLGFADVYWTGFRARLLVRAVAFLLVFALFFVDLRIAASSFGSIRRRISNIEIHEEIPERWLTTIALAGAAFLAFLFTAALSGLWLDVLAWVDRTPFGLLEPLFGRDVGWYVFALPVQRVAQNLAFLLLVAAIVVLGVVYVTSGGLEIVENRIRFRERPLRHLGVHVAILFLVLAWGYRLDLAELVFSMSGTVYGASYTDVHARVLGLRVLVALALVGAGIAAWDVFRGRYGMTLSALGALVLGLVVFRGVYPAAVQQFEVEPNEINKEAPYIARNIAYTRIAWDLDDITKRSFDVVAGTDPEALAQAGETLRNVRLWDWRPLLDTYSQLQEIRLYYEFEDVDVDRYDLGSGPRQVMLAARELAIDELPVGSQTWQNRHLIFTHGHGLVMSPVDQVTPEGLPMFFIRDIPPVVVDSVAAALQVTRPEIYFGERTHDYVLAATRTQEFDYPQGDRNIYTTYAGTGGISVASWFRRALFAWHFGSLKMLLTDDITPDSRLLLDRQIVQRARKIAPFLSYDADPYLVLLDGRMLWVIDAYTATDRFPYSQPVEAFGTRRRVNYVRNSVKVTIDAYDGDVTYWAWEPDDPLLATYARVFPTLFRPASEMPPGLRAHLRFPEDLFTLQAEVLRAYHMQEPKVFYNREDLWNIPNEIYQGQPQRMPPYYVLLQLPDDDRLAFQIVQPFTPNSKDNMIALLAAKADSSDYGRRVLYELPKDRLVYGPMQVEARIDQDPVISEQITLWSQKGSSVIRGNLLVIPIGRSVLYVEPLYLQAQQSQMPELKRVIVAWGSDIVMEPTLEASILALVRRSGGTAPARPAAGVPADSAAPAADAPPATEAALARDAKAAYDRAVAARRNGDWAGYGDALAELGRILDRMSE